MTTVKIIGAGVNNTRGMVLRNRTLTKENFRNQEHPAIGFNNSKRMNTFREIMQYKHKKFSYKSRLQTSDPLQYTHKETSALRFESFTNYRDSTEVFVDGNGNYNLENCNNNNNNNSIKSEFFADSAEICSNNSSMMDKFKFVTSVKDDPLEVISELPPEKILKVCKYNPNMARKFPQKQRSQQEQLRRDKNTEACRISRRKRKLEDLARDELIQNNTRELQKDFKLIVMTMVQVKVFENSVLKELQETDHMLQYLNQNVGNNK